MKFKRSKIISNKLIHSDSRGDFLSIIDDKINNISFLKSKKNTIRSNHYHLNDWHYIYVISGSIHYLFKKINEKKINYLHVKKGEVIFTPPMEIHTTYFSQETNMIVANGQNRKKNTYENDLVRFELANLKNVKSVIKKIKIDE